MERLEPISNRNRIKEPSWSSEFEVQAWLLTSLRAIGLNARGEVKAAFAGEKRSVCRFDIVIFEDGIAREVIEVKADQVAHKKGLEATRQAKRYTTFGVPVTFIYGMADAAEFVNQRRANAKCG
jgi:hypothetical protein